MLIVISVGSWWDLFVKLLEIDVCLTSLVLVRGLLQSAVEARLCENLEVHVCETRGYYWKCYRTEKITNFLKPPDLQQQDDQSFPSWSPELPESSEDICKSWNGGGKHWDCNKIKRQKEMTNRRSGRIYFIYFFAYQSLWFSAPSRDTR